MIDTSPAVTSCRDEFGNSDKRAKRIIAAVDDYANSRSGRFATENLLLCGNSRGNEAETFRDGARDYVRRHVFGSGIASMLIWLAVRWLVMAIINHYIDQLISDFDESDL